MFYCGISYQLPIIMPPKKVKPTAGMDQQRMKMQECWIDQNSKYLNTVVLFLAELFTTAMFFNWKGARTKSHEK